MQAALSFWVVRMVFKRNHDVSEEPITSIFRVGK
jgi:hypothetical protein